MVMQIPCGHYELIDDFEAALTARRSFRLTQEISFVVDKKIIDTQADLIIFSAPFADHRINGVYYRRGDGLVAIQRG